MASCLRAHGPWLLALLLTGCVLAAVVRADSALRVLVRVSGPADRALLERVRGQLSDVQVELITAETAALESSFSGQVEAAHALAADNDAQVVIWFANRQDNAQQILVHVATPREDRILTRQLRSDEKLGATDSGLLEAAALVVRTAVSALAAGGAIGVATHEAIASQEQAKSGQPRTVEPTGTGSEQVARAPEQEREQKQEAQEPLVALRARVEAPEPQPSAARESNPEPVSTGFGEDRNAPSPWHAHAFVGFQSVLDGQSNLGQRAVYARVGVIWRALLLGVYSAASFGSTIPDQFVVLHVARNAAGGVLDAGFDLGAHFRWAIGAHCGLLWFIRSTEPKLTSVQASAEAVTRALVFGPELLLSWLPGPVGLSLQLALDALPSATSFALDSSAQNVALHALWQLQPRASLGMEVRLP